MIVGFSQPDIEKIVKHLSKLAKYLDLNRAVIVGGLAIRYHLIRAGVNYSVRPFNDLDLTLGSFESISPKCSEEFWVYHTHLQDGHFFLALVDPESRTKVDVFDPKKKERAERVEFVGQLMQVVSLEDQLVKTVYDLQRISKKDHVDPKQFSDARLMLQIADKSKLPDTLVADLVRAEKIRELHPEWVQEKPFRRPRPYVCEHCVNIDGFPLMPMEEVYKVLGYVE